MGQSGKKGEIPVMRQNGWGGEVLFNASSL